MAPLRLHDVDDAERFVGAIAHKAGADLYWSDRDDLRQFLLVSLWELSERFEDGRGITFSGLAACTLRRRCVDWRRSRFGRTRWQWKGVTYEKRPPQFVPLDGDDDITRRELGATLGVGGLDSDSRAFAADMRLLDARSQQGAWAISEDA